MWENNGLEIFSDGRAGYVASDEDTKDGYSSNPEKRIVGCKAMHIYLGEYYAPFNTAVSVFLAFNEDGELIESAVRRDIDAL